MSSPLLSVVVPAYNSADFLLACLETLAVSGGEVEVVVVDNGSSEVHRKISIDLFSHVGNISDNCKFQV